MFLNNILKYYYLLGISKFRVQTDGSPLPHARHLTLMLFKNLNNICDHKNNELLVPWGQFVAHDMAYSPVDSINSSFPGKNYKRLIYLLIRKKSFTIILTF